ncbi:MAG TPA: glycine C-acetyltransferase [Patescibacteria group bacterium]|nr:glycine C-acetyltransferase [Patescibacteria group bacterium]
MTTAVRPQLQYLHDALEELKSRHLYYRLPVLSAEQKAVTTVNGREVINLSSNNYLGLTTHRKLRKAAIEATRKYGVGTAAVRSIAGTMDIHMNLEEQIAHFKHTEAAVVFQSGFTANAGTVSAVLGKDDLIVSDELNHASIIDGCRLSKATIRVFKHRDLDDCERILKETEHWTGRKLLITDGVFSMEGDVAPLPELCDLAEKYGCIMMVDDAHSTGVLGRGGRGTVDHCGCHGRVDIQVGTLSKAIGVMGGYVCGSRDLVEFLYHRARPFLFSTSHPPAVIGACQAAFSLLESADGERLVKRLWSNTKFFKRGLKRMGFDTGESQTPITPIMVGDAAKAFRFSQALFDEGIFAQGIGYPTVPEGRARLRTIVTAAHKRSDLERALEVIGRVGRRLEIVPD